MLLDVDACISTIDAWKIAGTVILVLKTIIPIILIVSGIVEASRVVISNNPEKVKPAVVTFIKKFIAGFLIFLAPIIVYSLINTLVDNNYDSKYYKCEKCLFFPTGYECEQFFKEKPKEEELLDEDMYVEGSLETGSLTNKNKNKKNKINGETTDVNTSFSPDTEETSKVYEKYDKEVKKEEKFIDNATNGPINKNVKAIGINGGVRIKFKKVSGAKSYILVAKDYNGKIHKVEVPNNVTDNLAHDYEKFKYSSDGYYCWDVKKINHEYLLINTWMNKNNTVYQFKLNAYSDSKGTVEISHSEWMDAVPFNIEKDVPELNVILPGRYVLRDPEDPKLKGQGFGSKAVKKKDNKRLDFSYIGEENGRVVLQWYNTIPGYTISSYNLKYTKHTEGSTVISGFKEVELSNSTNAYIIKGLTNEETYLVVLTSEGTYDGKKVTMQTTEVVIPHTSQSRKARLANVKRGNPQSGNYSLTSFLSKGDAEAFANYGYNGGAFTSNTDYFMWVNLYELRLYIFRKDQSKEWRLWKDTACGIGYNKTTSPGLWVINGKQWIWVWQSGNKSNSTYTPDTSWWSPNSSMVAVQWLVNFETSYMGNVFHTETYHGGMSGKIIRESRFITADCIQLDRLWEKWLYDYSMDSTLYVDVGG